MKYALIVEGRVHEIFVAKPVLHPSLEIVEGPDTIQAGDVFDGLSFTPYVPPQPSAQDVARAALVSADGRMARITEDLYDALMAKGVLVQADLPQAAQDTIAARKAARTALGGGA